MLNQKIHLKVSFVRFASIGRREGAERDKARNCKNEGKQVFDEE
jgi:hypothetical protein